MNKGDRLNNDEILLRRAYRTDKKYRDPVGRPTSRAFSPRPKDEGKLSVDIERLTTYKDSILDPIKFILYQFPSSLAFSLGLDCTYDPLPHNTAHSLITGFDSEDEAIPGIIARKAVEVNYP